MQVEVRSLSDLHAVIQAFVNVAAALGAVSGPLIIGGLTRGNPADGWRNYYARFCRLYITLIYSLT